MDADSSGRGFGLRPGVFDFFSGLLVALTLRALLCLGGTFSAGFGLAAAAVTLALTLRGLLCNGGSFCTVVGLAAAAAFMVIVIDLCPLVSNVTLM